MGPSGLKTERRVKAAFTRGGASSRPWPVVYAYDKARGGGKYIGIGYLRRLDSFSLDTLSSLSPPNVLTLFSLTD